MKITLPEALAQLEDYNANEIAELLRLAGKTGDRAEGESCPMANYLYDVIGEECCVEDLTAWVNVAAYTTINLPPGVTAFIEAFDRGRYPDLVTPREAE